MDKPILSKQAFWDVDMDKIDYEKNAVFIIERVAKKGTIDDFVSLLNFYNADRFRKVIVYSKELDTRDANFCCLLLNLKMGDFKQYIEPFVRPPWDFSGA